MTQNFLKILAVFIIGTIGGIFADQIFWPYFIERPLFLEYKLDKPPVYINETKQIFIQENTAFQDAVDKLEKVVVGVRTETKAKKILEGSGLIVTSDGLIITLAELLPKDSKTTLFFDGKILSPKIILIKDKFALLQIEENNLPTTGFANLENTKLGQRVFLIGVFFQGLKPQKIVNEGIISYFNEEEIHTNIFDKNNLQGSPLLNIEGNILGLNVLDQEGKISAIPIAKIKEFLGF
jgi:S1-C subfamily serine protease